MKKRKKHKSSFLVRLSAICLVLCLAYTLISTQLKVLGMERNIEQMQKSVEEQRLKNEEIEALLAIEESDEYVERIARDKLGFCYPDEQILIDRSGN